MFTHPSQSVYPLISAADLEPQVGSADVDPQVGSADAEHPLPEAVRPYEQCLRATLEWVRQYLCRPHPDLGRKGDVCPYAESSVLKGTFHMAVYPNRPADPGEITELLTRYRDWFVGLEPRTGAAAQFKTIVVLFPELDSPEGRALIDATQQLLKSEYVAHGLMIGEFHNGPPDKPGLWNPEFRPLRSPVPLLAIRHMVPTDLPFLRDDQQHVAAYLTRFADRVPAYLTSQLPTWETR